MMQNEYRQNVQEDCQAEDKLFNFRPIFFFAVFLCLGGGFALARLALGISLWWLTTAIPVFGVAVWLQEKARRLRAFAAVLVLALAFSLGLAGVLCKTYAFANADYYNGLYTVRGRVAESVRGNSTTVVTLCDLSVGNDSVDGKMTVYLPRTYYENVRLSDWLQITGEVQTDVGLFDEHGFRAVAIYDDVRYFLTVDSVDDCYITGRQFDLFLLLRQRITDTLRAGMDETTASVTMAVLMGDTSLMESGLLTNMRYGGIAHLFAVSGLHVGALYALCLFLAAKTPLSRTPKIVRFCVVAATLLFYGGICGYSASVLRATIMCLAFYAGKLTGYFSDGLENVGLSAIAVCLLSPVALFTVGFQLSYAATLGIVLLNRQIYGMFSGVSRRILCKCKGMSLAAYEADRDERPLTLFESFARSCIGFLSVTLSAQIATVPLTLAIFGYVSVWTLLLNCLFVPIVSAIFSALLAVAFFACLLPTEAASVALYVPAVVWSALLLVFQTADFSAGLIQSVAVPGGALICYYAACLFLTDKWNASKRYTRGMFFAFATVFLFVFLLANV